MPIDKIIAGAILGFLFIAFFIAGIARPLRTSTRPLIARIVINALYSAQSFAAGFIVVAPVSFLIMGWAAHSSFGLLNLLPFPAWGRYAIGFLLMDLSFYYWHRINHELPLLWRFHNVHHVDPDLDVTTSFRFHIVEILYSSGFRAVQVLLIGPPIMLYVMYELVFQAATMFHHSNVRLPIGVERALNFVLVTPRMHGIHHSAMKDETNSNYSVIFRWWDWLNRSLHLNVPHREITIGVPAYLEEWDNAFWPLLTMPFRRQRAYWHSPDGEIAIARSNPPDTRRAHLAE